MEKVLSGTRAETSKTYYELIAVITRAAARSKKSPITGTEVNILAHIASANKQGLLTKGIRRQLQQMLNLSPAALSNHLKRMRDKKLLVEVAGDLQINHIILPTPSIKVTLHEIA